MICRNCKYRANMGNTDECGMIICSYPASWFMSGIDDECHFIVRPGSRRPRCGDCVNIDDRGCWGCLPKEEIYHTDKDGNEHPCDGFYAKYEDQFRDALVFWLETGLKNKEDIIRLIEEFDEEQRQIRRDIEGDS